MGDCHEARGDTVDLAFQRKGAEPAQALTWRGPVGEFVLTRDDRPADAQAAAR